MYLIGVSKQFNNYSGRQKVRKRGRNRKVAFYFSESGIVHCEKQGFISFYLKKYFAIKWHRKKFYCKECNYSFTALVSFFSKSVECPNCL